MELKNKKKKILCVIVIIIFIIIVSGSVYYLNTKMNSQDEAKEERKITSTIFELRLNELYQNSGYKLIDDMNFINSMYYKKINTYDEYCKYKEIWNEIVEMKEEDFNDNFVILIGIENIELQNLIVQEVYTENDTLYIGMIKNEENREKKNGNALKVLRTMDKDNIEIYRTVKDIGEYNVDKLNIKSISKEYSNEQAQEDKCVIYEKSRIINEEIIIDFINKVENKKDANVRIIYDDYDGKRIVDVIYNSKIDKFLTCVDFTRLVNETKQTINYYEYEKLDIMQLEDINGIGYYLKDDESTTCIYIKKKD